MYKDSGNTIIELINSLISKNEITFALKLLEEFHFDEINIDKINYLKAICYLKSDKKDYNKALKFLECSPKKQTNHTEYLKHYCYFKTGNYESIVKFHLANEEKFNMLNENHKLIVAISYEKLNLLQNAKNVYKKIIASHPENKEAINNLSILEMKHAKSQDSISYLKKCYEIYPQNFAIANNYALCLIKNKFYEEGFVIFEKILNEYKENDLLNSNNKDEIMRDRIKQNYFNNLLKHGKNECIEKFVINELDKSDDITYTKLLIEKYKSINKFQEAHDLLKRIDVKTSHCHQLKKILNEIQIYISQIKSVNNSMHSKNLSQTEIYKAIEFTIENNDINLSKLGKINECENETIVEEIDDNNLSFSANKENTIGNDTEITKPDRDMNMIPPNNSDVNYQKQDVKLQAEKEDVMHTESILNFTDNKQVIDDNYIFERFCKRKKANTFSGKNYIKVVKLKHVKSVEEIYEDILTLFDKNDFTMCRENIDEYRENYSDSQSHNLEIACISAKIYYSQNEYLKVINELKKYYQHLNEETLNILISSCKSSKIDLDYLNYLEEYYIKYQSKEELILELIVTGISFYPKLDLNRIEKYVEIYFNKKNKNDSSAYEIILNILLANSNFLDYAYKLIERMKNSLNTTPLYYFYLGRFNLKKHNINQAYENFLKIEKQMGNRAEYKKFLGKIYAKLGNYSKAVTNFKYCLKNNPKDWTSSLSIGKCYIKLNDFVKAQKYLNSVCKINTNFEKSLKVNYTIGMLKYNLNNYESALDYFKKCIKLQPTSHKVMHYIALINIKNSEISEAESLLKQIENFFPSKFELFKIQLIYMNKTIDDFDKDYISGIEKHLENYPVFSIEYAELLIKYFESCDKAIEYFEKAVINGRNSIMSRSIEFVEILVNHKEYPKAIKCYQILLNNCNKDYRIFKGLKDIFISMKSYDEAIKTINTYIKHNQNSVEANVDLGDMYYKKQNYQKALDLYNQANNIIKLSKHNNFVYIIKKMSLCRIYLKLYETAFKNLEEYSKFQNEENVYLIMAYLKILYFDSMEEADYFLKVNYYNFIIFI